MRAGYSLAELKEETSAAIQKHYTARKENLRKEFGAQSNFEELARNFDHMHLDRLARLRVILEGQNSSIIDISQYALSEKPSEGSYNFSQGNFGISEFFMREFVPIFERENPKLVPTCENFAEKSREKLP